MVRRRMSKTSFPVSKTVRGSHYETAVKLFNNKDLPITTENIQHILMEKKFTKLRTD